MNSPTIFNDDLLNFSIKDSSDDDNEKKNNKHNKLNNKIDKNDFNNILSKP
jgi:hypothetical protein